MSTEFKYEYYVRIPEGVNRILRRMAGELKTEVAPLIRDIIVMTALEYWLWRVDKDDC